MTGDRLDRYSVTANYFSTQTTNSSSTGFYAFYNGDLVACYPIERTIIESIEKKEETA